MTAHHAHLSPERLLGFSLPKPGADGHSPTEVKDVLSRLRKAGVDWNMLGSHVSFDGAGYVRKRLYRDRHWEMLILCWLPGQTTVVHDHGGSWGATLVISGEISETGYRHLGEGRPMPVRLERSLAIGGTTVELPETVHRVRNASSAPAVSVHLYSPPLMALTSFDPTTGKTHRVVMEEGPSTAVGGRPKKRMPPPVPKRAASSRTSPGR